MRTVFFLVRKEFLQIFRDRTTVFQIFIEIRTRRLERRHHSEELALADWQHAPYRLDDFAKRETAKGISHRVDELAHRQQGGDVLCVQKSKSGMRRSDHAG